MGHAARAGIGRGVVGVQHCLIDVDARALQRVHRCLLILLVGGRIVGSEFGSAVGGAGALDAQRVVDLALLLKRDGSPGQSQVAADISRFCSSRELR